MALLRTTKKDLRWAAKKSDGDLIGWLFAETYGSARHVAACDELRRRLTNVAAGDPTDPRGAKSKGSRE